MIELAALSANDYERLRSDLRPYIKAAVYYSDMTTTAVECSILDGTRLPVVFVKDKKPIGLMTLEMDKDDVHVTTLAGDFQEDWKPVAFEGLKAITKAKGRKAITLKGRPGWRKLLHEYGFKPDKDELRCAL